MTASEKIKIIDTIIKQNKAQYGLDRKAAKIFALSLGNVSKYEFLISKVVLPEKDLLEKAATLESKSKEVKAQTDIANEKYQGLDYSFISNKDNKNVNESLTKKTTISQI